MRPEDNHHGLAVPLLSVLAILAGTMWIAIH